MVTKYILAFFLLIGSVHSFSEPSNSGLIGRLTYDSVNKVLYIAKETGAWASSSTSECHTGVSSSTDSDLSGIMSMALAAKLAGKEISFEGTCDYSNRMFTINSINVD